MKKYLMPVWVFIVLEGMFLFFLLFLRSIGDAGAKLQSDTASVASTFWLWTWLPSAAGFLALVIFQLAIWWITAKAFIHVKD